MNTYYQVNIMVCKKISDNIDVLINLDLKGKVSDRARSEVRNVLFGIFDTWRQVNGKILIDFPFASV